MFLKSMELFGFKSFAERTLIKFEPGITVVIGPNGCGKSNIVDAIKWVVGEKQAKNIRGQKMEDIIFSGTETRKPVSLAEVQVTIDNTQRIIEHPADEVTIGRRVFRDGESEYLINKTPVRLKDIERLFMDTGIGKSAYSVMEQGRMDLILSTRAEDRRYIFEEAAGISRYKQQKKESLRKLEETGEYLKRMNDVIKEVEREKELKDKQAEKTKQYLVLKDRKKEFDTKLSVLKFREFEKKLGKIIEDIAKLNKDREKISAKIASTSTDNEADEMRQNEIQTKLWELEKKLSEYKIRVDGIDQRTEKNRKAIEEQKNYLAGIKKKIEEREQSRKAYIAEKEKTEQNAREIREKIQSDKEARQLCFDRRKAKMTSIHNSRDTMDKNRELIKEHESFLSDLREELEVVIRQLIEAIDKRKAELLGSEEERQQVRETFHELLDKTDNALRGMKESLERGAAGEALDFLRALDIEILRKTAAELESFEDGFRSLLFDKSGIHAKKEELDTKINERMETVELLRKSNSDIEAFIMREQQELEDNNAAIARIEKDLSKHESDLSWMEDKHLQTLNFQIRDVEMQIENHKEDAERTERGMLSLQTEIEEGERRLLEFNEKSESLLKEQTDLKAKRDEINQKIHDRKNVSVKDEEELARIVDKITVMDKSTVELKLNKERVEEYLWTEYDKKAADLSGISVAESETAVLNEGFSTVKRELQILEPQVNPLAIEEFNELKKRFDYYINQKKDIEKARDDIFSVIDDINKISIEMFLGTFNEIQKNFSQIFKQLFEGGDASIELLDIENVLDSGIDINVRPPGKKLKSINLLSGGERALTAIALLFATYMVRPSPFCFLDEIDAPLDDQNRGRFTKMLKDFSLGTQFMVVTHNKETMRVGESIYGVTMEEPGVSKVVSLQMSKTKTAD